MSKHHISWENIQEWSADIAHKIAADCPDINHMTLVAVSRGGLIPAQLIAYRLNIRDIRVMKLISYDSDNKRGETKDISTDRLFDGSDVYFIDDLADSGETVRYLRRRFPNARQCTLITKDCCAEQPDLSAVTLPGDAWIVFPWYVD